MAYIIKDRIKETATTTGTGDFTLAGAMAGFKTFASVCATGDTFHYAIQTVTNGAPSGEWETGLGTYSAANTLTRTTVLDSSNAGAAVNFTAGSKQVWIGFHATQASWVREKLTADRTYYVRTDGSDSNTGLADTSGGAFLTVQKAIDVICQSLDASTYTATVQIKDGTYTGAITLKAHTGSLPYVIQGNASTPANVHINVTGTAITCTDSRVTAKIKDFKITSTTNSITVLAGILDIGGGIDFGSSSGRHINVGYIGYVTVTGNYTITGGATSHWSSVSGAVLRCPNVTITLTGTPNFSTAFANASDVSHIICGGNTYSGSATGVPYAVAMNSTISSSGGTLPGNSAGTTATGGQYA